MRGDDAREHLEDQGMFASELLDEIPSAQQGELQRAARILFVEAVNGISKIAAERGSQNRSGAPLPSALPQQLSKMKGRELSRLPRGQQRRLRRSAPAEKISKITEEHRYLAEAARAQSVLRNSSDELGRNASFEDSWRLVGNQRPSLLAFAGGLATVFPGACSVEADFSPIKRERSEHRQQLRSFSFEGLLHARQFEKLRSMQTK